MYNLLTGNKYTQFLENISQENGRLNFSNVRLPGLKKSKTFVICRLNSPMSLNDVLTLYSNCNCFDLVLSAKNCVITFLKSN